MISRDIRYGIERFAHIVATSAALAAGTNTGLLIATVPNDEIWELYGCHIFLATGIAIANKRAQLFMDVLGQGYACGRATDDPSTSIGLNPTVPSILVDRIYIVPPRANLSITVLNATVADVVKSITNVFRHEYIRP
ncbi:MAG: hypothetical protein Q7T82_21440 [Armatimonadota bacterium]|nr:hypothetical protein [Armatimonadota bacterium]